jgi:hypothetical protein
MTTIAPMTTSGIEAERGFDVPRPNPPAWRGTPFYTDRERAALAWTEPVPLISQGPASDTLDQPRSLAPAATESRTGATA